MKKKSIVCIGMLTGFSLLLCSCKSAIPELEEDEMNNVTAYMAQLILDHSTNYSSSILEEEEIGPALEEEARKAELAEKQRKEEEEAAKEAAKDREPDAVDVVSPGQQTVSSYSLTELIGIDGIEAEYISDECVMKYPNTDDVMGFAMTPTAGNKFLITTYQVSNVSGNDLNVDFLNQGINYSFVVNEDKSFSSITTLLGEDLSNYTGIIPIESGLKLVLVTEIPEDLNVDSLSVNVKNKSIGKSGKVNLR